MSSYPDDFRGTNMDHTPTEREQQALARMEKAREVYVKTLDHFVSLLIAQQFIAEPKEIESIMESVEELLYENVDGDRELLVDAGYDAKHEASVSPRNHAELCAQASERVFDALRVKPVDASGALREVMSYFRPVSTNPATLLATGKMEG